MPVYKMDKFPPDHPFAGVRVIFDAAMKRRVKELRARRDPMAEAERTIEQGLQQQCGERYLPPGANDPEGDDHG